MVGRVYESQNPTKCCQGVSNDLGCVNLRTDLGVDHGKGSGQTTAVDQEIEVNVDTRGGSRGVNNLLASVLLDSDVCLLVLVLLGDEGRNV
jgi:hypothetical protein